MSNERLTNWMNAYLAAWASNEPNRIRALFTADAVYAGTPDDPNPWRGIDAIVAGWLKDRDEPGTWRFSWEPLGVIDDLAIIQGHTEYTTGPDYSNLWVIRFAPDDRVREFTEWYMERPN